MSPQERRLTRVVVTACLLLTIGMVVIVAIVSLKIAGVQKVLTDFQGNPPKQVILHTELGKAGMDGTNGTDGAQGIQGIQGVQGAQGIQGEPGIQGEKGDTGTQGEPGAAGREIELRTKNGQLEWRYVGTQRWTPVSGS